MKVQLDVTEWFPWVATRNGTKTRIFESAWPRLSVLLEPKERGHDFAAPATAIEIPPVAGVQVGDAVTFPEAHSPAKVE